MALLSRGRYVQGVPATGAVTVLDMGSARYTTRNGVHIPEAAMSWSYAASGGPGGQHANKTSSKATLRIDTTLLNLPAESAEMLAARYGTVIQVYSSTSRSQAVNREECLRKAGERIDEALEVRPARRPSRVPSRAKRERVEGKRRRGLTKQLRRGWTVEE